MTAKIKLNAASGGGSVSIQAPSSSSNNRVISLPDIADGTLLTSQSSLDSTKLSPAIATGVTMIDQYRVTTNAQGDQEPIQNNLERVDNARNGLLNAGMTVSSGVWTFPSTGYYEIYAQVVSYVTSGVNNRELRFYMYTTVDNGSNWSDVIHAYDQQFSSSSYTWATSQFKYIIDITDTSNDKIKFYFSPDNTNAVMRGHSDVNYSCFIFKKIAET